MFLLSNLVFRTTYCRSWACFVHWVALPVCSKSVTGQVLYRASSSSQEPCRGKKLHLSIYRSSMCHPVPAVMNCISTVGLLPLERRFNPLSMCQITRIIRLPLGNTNAVSFNPFSMCQITKIIRLPPGNTSYTIQIFPETRSNHQVGTGHLSICPTCHVWLVAPFALYNTIP